jgi:predicted amidophosphoribosyltransferase
VTAQVGENCPHCQKSWYRQERDGRQWCNVCGKETPFYYWPQVRFIPGQRGRIWSKKKHRYLTAVEIKNGEKGG